MKHHRIAMILAGLSLILGVPAAAAPHHPAAAAKPARPALWRVARGSTTIYLFGTIHALPKGISWFAGPVAQKFASSNELVTEIIELGSADMKRIVTAKAMLPAGQTLRAMMAPADRKRFDAAMAANGLPAAALDGYQPWFAAVELSTLPLLKSGYDPANGVDSQLAARATTAGLPHEALETPEFQLGLFASLPQRTQLAYLHEVLTTLPQISRELAGMVRAWKAGDALRLAALMNADEDDPQLRTLLLVRRNQAWAQWISARLAANPAKPNTIFIAVGAGHLAGADSVLDLLRRRGIMAQRVQ